MSGEVKSQGTTLSRGTGSGSPETFETVTGLLDFSGPTPSRGEIDTTDLDSTAKEFMLGLKDNGEMTFNGKLKPADSVHQDVIADLDNDVAGNWKVTLSDGTKIEFAAFVKDMPITGGTDDIVKYSLTLRITGDITWTYAS